jgi:hypothetical protein
MRSLIKPIIVWMVILFAATMQAQVSINVNLGATPAWIPQVETGVRYYYLPDVDAYYDMRLSVFIFSHNGNWIRRHHLLNKYRNYDLYDGRKVAVRNYCGNSPYAYSNYQKHNKWDMNDYNRLAQRTDRGNHRNNVLNEKSFREQHDWKNNKDRRSEHNNRGGHGHDHR